MFVSGGNKADIRSLYDQFYGIQWSCMSLRPEKERVYHPKIENAANANQFLEQILQLLSSLDWTVRALEREKRDTIIPESFDSSARKKIPHLKLVWTSDTNIWVSEDLKWEKMIAHSVSWNSWGTLWKWIKKACTNQEIHEKLDKIYTLSLAISKRVSALVGKPESTIDLEYSARPEIRRKINAIHCVFRRMSRVIDNILEDRDEEYLRARRWDDGSLAEFTRLVESGWTPPLFFHGEVKDTFPYTPERLTALHLFARIGTDREGDLSDLDLGDRYLYCWESRSLTEPKQELGPNVVAFARPKRN